GRFRESQWCRLLRRQCPLLQLVAEDGETGARARASTDRGARCGDESDRRAIVPERRRPETSPAAAVRSEIQVQESRREDCVLAGGAGARQVGHSILVRPPPEGGCRHSAVPEIPREERAERVQPAGG